MGKIPSERKQRNVLIKKESSTKRTNKRIVKDLIKYGIVNLDKPRGPTSHQVSDYVKDILDLKKAGHSGTLDPNVTGVLPTALERATRIVQALIPAGKEYVCIMHVHGNVKENKLRKTIESFRGKIKQKPPIKSAVKRVPRFRKIYYIDVLEIEGKDVLFKVGCEAGTYIRKLCHDMGERLSTGAHMAELRRTKVGPFKEDTLVTLQDLTDAYWYWKNKENERYLRKCIQPIEKAIEHYPKIWILDSAVQSLCNGVNLKVPGISKLNDKIEPDQKVAVMTLADELIALGRAKITSKKMLEQKKGVAVRINKVFMQN